MGNGGPSELRLASWDVRGHYGILGELSSGFHTLMPRNRSPPSRHTSCQLPKWPGQIFFGNGRGLRGFVWWRSRLAGFQDDLFKKHWESRYRKLIWIASLNFCCLPNEPVIATNWWQFCKHRLLISFLFPPGKMNQFLSFFLSFLATVVIPGALCLQLWLDCLWRPSSPLKILFWRGREKERERQQEVCCTLVTFCSVSGI